MRLGESFGGAYRTVLPFPHCVWVGIPLSTRNDLGTLALPKSTTHANLYGSRPTSATKINPTFSGRLNFLAERIGLEPMDQKFRSQISNLLHYHSANAPFRVVLYINCKIIASRNFFAFWIFVAIISLESKGIWVRGCQKPIYVRCESIVSDVSVFLHRYHP